jgi:hypothetical protein
LPVGFLNPTAKMKKLIFSLHFQEDPFLIEIPCLIVWLDYLGCDAIATPDLICLIEEFYFSN